MYLKKKTDNGGARMGQEHDRTYLSKAERNLESVSQTTLKKKTLVPPLSFLLFFSFLHLLYLRVLTLKFEITRWKNASAFISDDAVREVEDVRDDDEVRDEEVRDTVRDVVRDVADKVVRFIVAAATTAVVVSADAVVSNAAAAVVGAAVVAAAVRSSPSSSSPSSSSPLLLLLLL